MGGMFALPHELRMKLENEARLEADRASFEIRKLYRIIEELGGPPLSTARKNARTQTTFRGYWPVDSSSPLFQSHMNATANQCDQLDVLWQTYGKTLYKGSKQKRDEVQRLFERELVAILDKSQLRRVKQLRFRQLWFSQNPEEAFYVTKIQLTKEDQTLISGVANKLKSAYEAWRADRDRPYFLSQLDSLLRDAPKLWLDMEKEFNDTLVQIVGEERAQVLLGDPMVLDRAWKRPVDASHMTIAQAEQQIREIESKLSAIEKLDQQLEASFDVEFEAEETNEDRMDQLEEQMSAVSSQRTLLRKKLQLAERVLEELGAK